MKETKLHLGYAGYCLANENEAIKGGPRRKTKFFATWGLILHPQEGYLLFDTGYSRRFYKETKHFPAKIYAMITKVSVSQDDEVATQLSQAGISHTEIKKVFISHFHADHIGGLLDFPNAEIITSKMALENALKLNKRISFAKGILKGFIPDDILNRVSYTENCKQITDRHFGLAYDLFDDNSILIYNLPGHAPGQSGIMLQTSRQQYFLISDACWMKKSYEENITANPIIKLIIDSWSEYKGCLEKIYKYSKAHPNTIIVPTHCAETTDKLIAKTVQFDKL